MSFIGNCFSFAEAVFFVLFFQLVGSKPLGVQMVTMGTLTLECYEQKDIDTTVFVHR